MRLNAAITRYFIVLSADVHRNVPYLAIIVFIEVTHEDVPPVPDQFPPASAGGIFIVFMLLQFDLHPWSSLASSRELAVSETSTFKLPLVQERAETGVTNVRIVTRTGINLI